MRHPHCDIIIICPNLTNYSENIFKAPAVKLNIICSFSGRSFWNQTILKGNARPLALFYSSINHDLPINSSALSQFKRTWFFLPLLEIASVRKKVNAQKLVWGNVNSVLWQQRQMFGKQHYSAQKRNLGKYYKANKFNIKQKVWKFKHKWWIWGRCNKILLVQNLCISAPRAA